MCHMSGVTCQVSYVRCHMSDVICQVSDVRCPVSGAKCQVSHVTSHVSKYIFFFDKEVELVGGGSVIHEAYPV